MAQQALSGENGAFMKIVLIGSGALAAFTKLIELTQRSFEDRPTTSQESGFDKRIDLLRSQLTDLYDNKHNKPLSRQNGAKR